MTAGNGALPLLIQQIDSRLERIECAIDNLARMHGEKHDRIDNRLNALESHNAELRGSWKAAAIMASASATAGGLVATLLGKIWPT